MSEVTPDIETVLASTLRGESSPPPDLALVLRRARHRLAVRHVLTHVLGRIWLALARLFAPAVVRLHRLSHPSTHNPSR